MRVFFSENDKNSAQSQASAFVGGSFSHHWCPAEEEKQEKATTNKAMDDRFFTSPRRTAPPFEGITFVSEKISGLRSAVPINVQEIYQ